MLVSAVAIAVAAFTALSGPVLAQRGSVYGPRHNPHYMSNGTGTVTDWNRDPHNDR